MFDLSDDDSYSTQLEGKKLKNRGARMEGSYKNDPLLEIDKDAPGLMEEAGIGEGQEYFTDRELQGEGKEERGERLKKELAAARQQQLALQKQQQQQLRVERRTNDPNLKLDEIEQGVLQSQHKGHSVEKQQAKQHIAEKDHEHNKQEKPREEALKKTDVAAVSALLGPDNVKNMNLSDDVKLAEKSKSNSVPAKLLPDVRGKESGLGI